MSTLEPRKNLDRLVAAYGPVRSVLPEPWPLVVVGPADGGPHWRRRPGVVLAGRAEEAVLSALYASARVVAYVPLAEGFGLPAVEAMSAGAPRRCQLRRAERRPGRQPASTPSMSMRSPEPSLKAATDEAGAPS